MNFSKVLIVSLILTAIISCDTKKRAKVYFQEKFPDHARDLTHALPDTFLVKYNNSDTTHFAVSYDKSTGINYIVNIEESDTLYKGYAAKYNGLYFLSRMIDDSSYHIHALHTDGYTIKGLHTEPLQIKLVQSALKNELKGLIASTSENRILLSPEKELLFPYFRHLLTKLRGDTILDYNLHMKK